jgi:hypothetical protein
MHSASTALCVLVALAAAGTELVSAATPPSAEVPVAPGHYRVDAKLLRISTDALKHIPGGLTDHCSSEALGLLERSAGPGSFSFPTVEAAKTIPVSVSSGELNPTDSSQHGETVLTLVPEVRDSKPGYSLRLASLRGPEFAKAGKPTFDTIQTDVGAESAGGYWCFRLPAATGHAVESGRQQASLADAHQRQLLFVKITRG